MEEKKSFLNKTILYILIIVGIAEIGYSLFQALFYNLELAYVGIIPGVLLILLSLINIAENYPIADLVEVSMILIASAFFVTLIPIINNTFLDNGYTFSFIDYLKGISIYPISPMYLIDFPWYWGFIAFIAIAWVLGVLRVLYLDTNHLYFIGGFIIDVILASVYLIYIQNAIYGISGMLVNFFLYLLILIWTFGVGFYAWFAIVYFGVYILREKPSKVKSREAFKLK